MASPKKASDRTPLENAQLAFDKARAELSQAQQAIANLRLEESKNHKIRGADDDDILVRVKMLTAERTTLEREQDVYTAGIALNEQLLAEETRDPDVFGSSIQATLNDLTRLHELGQRYRSDAIALMQNCFSAGEDPTTILANSAGFVALATEAEKLFKARITHAQDCRTRLRSRRSAEKLPLPPVFPKPTIDAPDGWIQCLRSNLDVPASPSKNYPALIGAKRREEDLARAELQQRAMDRLAARTREEQRIKAEKEDQRRKAEVAAEELAERQAQIEEFNKNLRALAEQHRKANG
jgi:hypothetical protein